MCYSFLTVFNSTNDVFCVLQKSYARQVKLSRQPYAYYFCKQYATARACSARNFPTFLGRLWLNLLFNSLIMSLYLFTE